MTEPVPTGSTPSRSLYPYGGGQESGANLADILERVLDKGIVIVGDIKINLLDIELLTIKLRLLVASVDKAKEIGIDWWEHDPSLSSRANRHRGLEEQNERLRAEVEELRRKVERSESAGELPERASGGGRRSGGAESRRTESRRTESRGTESRGTESRGTESRGAKSRATEKEQPGGRAESAEGAEPRRPRRKTRDRDDEDREP